MKTYNKITPEGTRDLLFEECSARRLVEGRLRHVFESRGYQEVMTPGMEFYDVFGSTSQYFPQESMYKLIDSKGRLLVMRPDSTIPIARLTATKLQSYTLPIRLYYSQNVYRMDTALNGGSHEIMQMGIELLGAAEGKADLEILATGAQSLAACGVKDYRLELGNVGIFKALMANLVADDGVKETIQQLVENKNYAALNDLLAQFPETREAALLQQLPRLFGGAEVFAQGKALFADYDAKLLQAVDDLEQIYRNLEALGLAQQVLVDFGLINQADYYSGLIFRGYIEGIGAPVLSGGRYDQLLGDFGKPLPAIGFGIQVDLIARVLLRAQNFTRPQDALIFATGCYVPQSLALMTTLNAQGMRCEYALAETADEAMAYARQAGIAVVYLVGETVERVAVQS